MSTRSGKRIHSSFHENVIKTDIEDVMRSERKTRSKRMKENSEEFSVSVIKSKKRNNYVTYPTDDEISPDAEETKEDEGKITRSLRKNALKERNTISNVESEQTTDNKTSKQTRRTRKTTEVNEDILESVNDEESTKTEEPKRKNKGKKKKKSLTEEPKKKSKKIKASVAGSLIVEDIQHFVTVLNKSNESVESFHSAAGSPVKQTDTKDKNYDSINNKEDKNATFDKLDDEHKTEGRKTRSGKQLTNIEVKRKRKSSVKALSVEKNVNETITLNSEGKCETINIEQEINSDVTNCTKNEETIFATNVNIDNVSTINADLEETEDTAIQNITFDKDSEMKSVKDTTFEKDSESNITFNKDSVIKSVKDTTFEKEKSIKDTTFDKESCLDKRQSINNSTFEKTNLTRKRLNKKDSIDKTDTEINSTYEKVDDKSLNNSNATFEDKNATFDKESKTSIISSDNSTITLDKSDVRISITSDESTENIVNTTPVLIESSLDESQLKSPKSSLDESPIKSPKTMSPKRNLDESQIKSPKNDNLKLQTPLKREGTFTKDVPEVPFKLSKSPENTQIPQSPAPSKTPPRKMSLPSPGCTPFPKNKELVLNVTRSIEKSRRSSVADPQPRTTKVMFCSPVNNPAVVSQQKRKVIKSNLKGSSKSFVFDESTVEPRSAPRKRSYTHSEADSDARVKRKRLGDDMQTSVDRLSRPRTSSASAKLTEPTTPSKKTPKKSESKITRTKLPNFAALHQKQFEKMESLDECQERKAKRAKQLLTPTGSVNIIERISPKETDPKPQQSTKPETPIKSLPTLKSLNPGYTRFGFKLNLDVNPFSIVSKTDAKSKDNKPKWLKREATLPSLTGATGRKESARQTVMREKSFTDKRNMKRTENRTIIKGVRTNRRFELQMRMRNID